MQAARDAHGRVRLEAIVAASWLDNTDGARIALEALKFPLDKWMGPATDYILKYTLKDDIEKLVNSGFSLADNPNARDYLDGTFEIAKAGPSPEEQSYGPTRQLSGDDAKLYALGKEVFNRDAHCGTCHQPNGQGIADAYPPLTSENNPWLVEDERMIKIVLKGLWGPLELNGKKFDPTKGVPPMPGFAPLLSDEEIAAVISYVRQSYGNDLPLIKPSQVARIREQTSARADFYMIEDIMQEHPIPGWEAWGKSQGATDVFE